MRQRSPPDGTAPRVATRLDAPAAGA